MIVSMNGLLPYAATGRYIIPGFNIFGLDEAWAVLKAAESVRSPVILMTNKDMVKTSNSNYQFFYYKHLM